MLKDKKGIILTGLIIGIIAAILVKLGNPGNMGFCIACFLRDITGALGLHQGPQYARPEIIGLVLGAFIAALVAKEFSARAGSAPVLRFVLGFAVTIGALMFLGCPLRMILRLGGGDLNAILGLLGFIAGIALGIIFLNKGFTLKRTRRVPTAVGYLLPAAVLILLVIVFVAPALLFASAEGPGAAHAPVLISLAVGLIIGILAQRTRLCMAGGIRDVMLCRDWHLASGFIAIFLAVLIGNLIFGQFHLGFAEQPVAHTDGLWNFLGMLLVGLGSVLLGGCPFRQLILSGEGNFDSVITVLGMLVGAIAAHNFGLASSPQGPTTGGQIAVIIGILVVLAIGYFNIDRSQEIAMKGDVNIDA